MADNKIIDNGALADFTIATDEIAGIDWQYIKMAFGLDGTATIVSASNPLPVAVGSGPAVDRTVDGIAVSPRIDGILQAGTVRTVSKGIINANALGDNQLVAAQGTGNKILVLQMVIMAAAAVTARIQSNTAGTYLTGAMPLGASGGFAGQYNPHGIFDPTAANETLNLELSAAVAVGGFFTYAVIT